VSITKIKTKMKKTILILAISILLLYCLCGAFSGGGEAESPTEPIAPSNGSVYMEVFDLCTSNVIECEVEKEEYLITKLAKEYNVPVDEALTIAECESNFNPLAKNPNSTAKGLYQFIDGTWDYFCEGDVLNAEDNARCFMELYPKYPHYWECKA
jgi:hypothetical protein